VRFAGAWAHLVASDGTTTGEPVVPSPWRVTRATFVMGSATEAFVGAWRPIVDRVVLTGSMVLAVGLDGWAAVQLARRARLVGAAMSLGVVTLVATVMFLQAMGLGGLGLSSSPLAFLGAAVVTAGVTSRWSTAARVPAAERRLDVKTVVLVGATAGLVFGSVVYSTVNPAIGADSIVNHLAQPVAWVQAGTMGDLARVSENLPFEAYPVTHEVLVGWGLGASHAFGWVSFISATARILLGLGVYVAARACQASRFVATLAAASILVLPVCAVTNGGPNTDIPAAAWTASAVAFALLARSNARAYAFAILAAGLAMGTKTTAVLGPGLVLIVVVMRNPRILRTERRLLLGAGATAAAIGAWWPLRNIIEHGGPLWPFIATPGSEPIPAEFAAIDDRFISQPATMLRGREVLYLEVLGGAAVLLVGALLLVRQLRRDERDLFLITALCLVAWTVAPYTAITRTDGLAVGALRYLLPAIAIGAVGVAAASRTGSVVAQMVLASSIPVSLAARALLPIPVPVVVPVRSLLLFASVGVAIGACASKVIVRRGMPGLSHKARLAGTVAAAVLSVALLTVASSGWTRRSAMSEPNSLGEALVATIDSMPSSTESVAVFPSAFALLASDDLEIRIDLIDAEATCDELATLTTREPVLIFGPASPRAERLMACLVDLPAAREGEGWRLWLPQ